MANLLDILNSQNNESIEIDMDSLTSNEQLKILQADRYKSNTSDRKWLAIWTACVVSVWLIGVYVILLFNDKFICLNNSVLITLLTTTTINVLGLVLIVLRGHFNLAK